VETEPLNPDPTPPNPPAETIGPDLEPPSPEIPEVENLEGLEAEPDSSPPPPARIPFRGAELAAFAGILGMALARPKSMGEVSVFGEAFHGPIRLSLPAMGLDFSTSVAEALDSLRVGEALAAFGIYKPGGWGGDLGELPPLLRLALGVAVVGYAGFGGIRAVQEYRAAQAAQMGTPGSGPNRVPSADDAN